MTKADRTEQALKVIALSLGIILAMLLVVIIILQTAPESRMSLWIDGIVAALTSGL